MFKFLVSFLFFFFITIGAKGQLDFLKNEIKHNNTMYYDSMDSVTYQLLSKKVMDTNDTLYRYLVTGLNGKETLVDTLSFYIKNKLLYLHGTRYQFVFERYRGSILEKTCDSIIVKKIDVDTLIQQLVFEYEHGKKHGLTLVYFKGKELERVYYNKDNINGLYVKYNIETGKLSSVASFTDNVLDGLALGYFTSGNIAIIEYYKMGKIKEQFFYNELGLLIERKKYNKYGKVKSSKTKTNKILYIESLSK